MKNELAAARPPSQKFGANAAWFALNAVTYNVLSALRAAAPDPALRVARVKSLRYHLLTASARLTRFSRKITLRFAGTRDWIGQASVAWHVVRHAPFRASHASSRAAQANSRSTPARYIAVKFVLV